MCTEKDNIPDGPYMFPPFLPSCECTTPRVESVNDFEFLFPVRITTVASTKPSILEVTESRQPAA